MVITLHLNFWSLTGEKNISSFFKMKKMKSSNKNSLRGFEVRVNVLNSE